MCVAASSKASCERCGLGPAGIVTAEFIHNNLQLCLAVSRDRLSKQLMSPPANHFEGWAVRMTPHQCGREWHLREHTYCVLRQGVRSDLARAAVTQALGSWSLSWVLPKCSYFGRRCLSVILGREFSESILTQGFGDDSAIYFEGRSSFLAMFCMRMNKLSCHHLFPITLLCWLLFTNT